MVKKVVVLGSTGMLGLMVYHYLKTIPTLSVIGTTRDKEKISKQNNRKYFEAEFFLSKARAFSYLLTSDYIINCIGIIKPHCKDTDEIGIAKAIKTNALFPHVLSKYVRKSSAKVLQIATDCVYSGLKGNYNEDASHDALDVYGKTKSLGEVIGPDVLHIRCSIIGPELHTRYSLLEWFLHQKDNTEIQGFTHHKWNGVTTLQFAKLCRIIIERNTFNDLRKESHIHHFVPNNSITKYELLKLLQREFHKHVTIIPVSDIGIPIDRTLSTKYQMLKNLFGLDNLRNALKELHQYINSYE